jgi:hypothetical protein
VCARLVGRIYTWSKYAFTPGQNTHLHLVKIRIYTWSKYAFTPGQNTHLHLVLRLTAFTAAAGQNVLRLTAFTAAAGQTCIHKSKQTPHTRP